MASPAAAHADLVAADPPDGSRLASAPARVTLTFSERISLGVGFVRVVDQRGTAVSTGPPQLVPGTDDAVAVPLPANLPDGGYLVSFQVVSADSHPVSGAVAFTVGDGPLLDASGAVLDGTGTDPLLGVLLAVARWVSYAGLALLGGVVFLRACWPAGRRHRQVRRLVWAGWLGVVLAATAELAGQGPYAAGGGLADLVTAGAFQTTMRLPVGQLLILRLVTVAALGTLLPRLLAPPRNAPPADPPAPSPPVPPLGPSGAPPAALPTTAPLTVGPPTAIAPTVPPSPAALLAAGPVTEGPPRTTLPAAAPATGEPPTAIAPTAAPSPAAPPAAEPVTEGPPTATLPAAAPAAGEPAEARPGPQPDPQPGSRHEDVAGLIGLVVLLSYAGTGHAVAAAQPTLAVLADVAHLAAMAVWLGGLVMLVGLLRLGGPAEVATALHRFSRLALGAVVVLVGTGTYRAVTTVGSPAALWSTGYGRLLSTKVLAVAGLLVLACLARRTVRTGAAVRSARPAAAAGSAAGPAAPAGGVAGLADPAGGAAGLAAPAGGVAGPAAPAGGAVGLADPANAAGAAAPTGSAARELSRLRRTAGAEVLIGIAVLAVTAALVAQPPGRLTVRRPAAVDVDLGPAGTANVRLNPNRAGPNDLRLRLTRAGRPVEPREVSLTLALPADHVGPLRVPLQRTGPGGYQAAGVGLPRPGRWLVTVRVRSSTFDATVGQAAVDVR